jgi:hypothetical protein
MAQTLFSLLVNAPDKRYVLLAEGTHSIIMERNRLKLFEAVQALICSASVRLTLLAIFATRPVVRGRST